MFLDMKAADQMDDKSGMMKYQTGSHDDIISFILNGRGKSVY